MVLDDGFEVRLAGEIIAEMRWAKVRHIFAYTRFWGDLVELCLAFAPSRSAGQIVTQESLDGWESLVTAMHRAFPSADMDWREKAVLDEEGRTACLVTAAGVPSFTVNPVLVWPAP